MVELNKDSQNAPQVRSEALKAGSYDSVLPVAKLVQQSEVSSTPVLKLDANENPFGTSRLVLDAVASVESFSVYPDPAQTELRSAIADYLGVSADQIVVGAGSDELIELTMRLLVSLNQHVLSFPPTFGMYEFLAGVHGITIEEIDRRDDFNLDINSALDVIGESTGLVIVASPNNPNGSVLPDSELRLLLATGATIMVDEAYAEFSKKSFVDWTIENPNLIVLRTFSKWAGLAGLRVGYGVFHPSVVDVLMRLKQPYSVNSAAEAAALAALVGRDKLNAQVAAIIEGREILYKALKDIPWLTPYPSSGNFILCSVDNGKGLDIYESLARRGVFIRFYQSGRMQGFIRISVPRPDQHKLLLENPFFKY